MTAMEQMGKRAKEAAAVLAVAGRKKNDALLAIAQALLSHSEEILKENQKDLENGKNAGLTPSLLDRLALSQERIAAMAEGVRQVAAMPDPIGTVLSGGVRPNGLEITKVRVPLGVIGIIFEARPNVTSDAAALCLKAGNAVILRGGKEAIHSNLAIAGVMREAVAQAGLPRDSVQLVEDTSRQSSVELMELTEYLDVLIPRGGAGLIKTVVEKSKVPVIETGVGNCHVYIDSDADLEMAASVVYNAKTSRPSVCNAIETILVHEAVAERFLPLVKKKLDEKKVELHGDEKTREILGGCVIPAAEEDWVKEYLDYKLSVAVVDDVDAAIAHIAKHSTHHSEAIVTADAAAAQQRVYQPCGRGGGLCERFHPVYRRR